MKAYRNAILLIAVLMITMLKSTHALTIEARLKPNQHITFFFQGINFVRLKNNGNKDSTIKANISLSTLTEVGYAVGFKDNNQLKNIFHTMLLAPTDSLVFGKNGYQIYVINKKNKSVFLDATIEAGSLRVQNARRLKIITLESFKKYWKSEKENLLNDFIKIDSLQKQNIIDVETSQNWHAFRNITFYALIFQFVDDKRIQFDPFIAINYSFYEEALTSLNGKYIKGNLTSGILRHLYMYWNKKNAGLGQVGMVDFCLNEREKISSGYIYESLLGYIENVTVKNTKTYQDGLEKIKQYAKKYDSKLYEKCIAVRFFDMSQVRITNATNKSFTLEEVVMLSGKKYVVIDMWASWCSPCREQMPFFHKIKKELQSSDIAFINISTDNNTKEWLKALEEENLSHDVNQYRIANSQQSALAKFFKIQTIPRYIVLENSGKVISDQFFLPTENEFKPSLERISQ
jgi:thiol-disulfide isomerase/thioredoxin